MASDMHILHNRLHSDPCVGVITLIFSISNDVSYGLDKYGNWVTVASFDSKVDFIEEKNQYFNNSLLLLLEVDYKKFKSEIHDALTKNRLHEYLYKGFPLITVVEAGIRTESDWWVDLSLNWMENFDKDELISCKDLTPIINDICNCKLYPQKLRHKARKVVSRLDNC